MRTFTVDEMMNCKPCYTRDRVVELWVGRERCGAHEIINMPIPSEDKIWALSLDGVLTADINQRWKDVFVARVVTNHALTYTACPEVVEWAKAWLGGNRAASAAWSAAESAAMSAARLAARSAAWSAAESAAESVAWLAARSAEHDQQIEDLRAILKQEEDGRDGC